MKIIDISVPISVDMPFWPKSVPYSITKSSSIKEGANANVSVIHTGVHIGTHVDAPNHFIDNGKTMESMSLYDLIGEASVINFTGFREITAEMLDKLPPHLITKRMLFKTSNSALWAMKVPHFKEDFTALTKDAAQWIADKGVRLVGIDYLSIQLYKDTPDTHWILLGKEIVILEGLNLSEAAEGVYDFVCLPLNLVGAEGAPARAVLLDRE